MAKPKRIYTLDEDMFTWIEHEKTLNEPGRPPEAAKKRQRRFVIRNIARKEIADLTKLAKRLPQDQLDQIFNKDNLEGLVMELLWSPVLKRPDSKNPEGPGVRVREPDLETAMIAQLLIEYGFSYLIMMKPTMVTLSHRRTIDEAIDLSKFLLESFKPNSK